MLLSPSPKASDSPLHPLHHHHLHHFVQPHVQQSQHLQHPAQQSGRHMMPLRQLVDLSSGSTCCSSSASSSPHQGSMPPPPPLPATSTAAGMVLLTELQPPSGVVGQPLHSPASSSSGHYHHPYMDYTGLARIGQHAASTAASTSTASGDSTSGVYSTDDQMLPSAAAAAASLAGYAVGQMSSIYVYNVPGGAGGETNFEALTAGGEYAYYETTGAAVPGAGTLTRRRCSVGPLEPSAELITSSAAVPQELPMDQMYVQFINKRDVDPNAEKVLADKSNGNNNNNRTVRIGKT